MVSSVPAPSMEIIALNNQTVGQSLTLESTITTVRGITSRVDIVWSSNGVELRRINNTNTSLTINGSELYIDTFNVTLLSTSDDGRVFQCEMIIMTTPPSIVTTKNIALDVTGKCCRCNCYWLFGNTANSPRYVCTYICIYTCM